MFQPGMCRAKASPVPAAALPPASELLRGIMKTTACTSSTTGAGMTFLDWRLWADGRLHEPPRPRTLRISVAQLGLPGVVADQ